MKKAFWSIQSSSGLTNSMSKLWSILARIIFTSAYARLSNRSASSPSNTQPTDLGDGPGERGSTGKGNLLLANAISRSYNLCYALMSVTDPRSIWDRRTYAEGLYCPWLVVRVLLGPEESLRLEAEGLAEVPCAVICRELRNAHDGSFWHKAAGDVRPAFWHYAGGAAWHRRIASEGLFDTGEHCVQLRVSLLIG